MRLLQTLILSLCLAFNTSLLAEQPAMASTVNINTADVATLSAMLKGVGESKAQAIVAYRENYGPFKAVEELTAVKGIGESLLEKNRKKITLE